MSKSVSRLTNLLLSSNGSDIALLLLRIFVGIMMLTHGVAKIENFSALKANFPDPVGLGAGFSLLLITCAEVGCSLLVIVGLVTRLAVIPLIVGMCVAAFLTFHDGCLGTRAAVPEYLHHAADRRTGRIFARRIASHDVTPQKQ